MRRQWHDLPAVEINALARPRTNYEVDRILAAVYGDDLEPVVDNSELWREKAKREGLCWWSFAVVAKDGGKLSINVFFWDLDLTLTAGDRVVLGEAGVLALEDRLDRLAWEWGVERENDARTDFLNALAAIQVKPGQRRRPSGLTRISAAAKA